uniref:Uncharacterized protein n=1 Tax=Tetradesmus obliquus TaxID=3088 RepID=A0A383WEG4_TETOB|eukprot:jgi/Sobl393_1/18718/SZX75997.1
MQQHKEHMHTSSMTKAFNFVLQHPNTALDAAAVCGLLCSSKDVRATAQQEGGPCTSICVKRRSLGDKQVASRATDCAKWLPPHAHLVADYELDMTEPPPPDDDSEDYVDDEMQRRLDMFEETAIALDNQMASSLPQIAAGDCSSGSASTAASGSNQEQQQPPRRPFAAVCALQQQRDARR